MIVLSWSGNVAVIVLSLSGLDMVPLSLSDPLGIKDVVDFEWSEIGTGTTETVLLTWTVTTREDSLSLPVVGDEEMLKPGLLDVARDDVLSLSGMVVVDDREVEKLSLSRKVDVVVSLSLSDARDEIDDGSLSVDWRLP